MDKDSSIAYDTVNGQINALFHRYFGTIGIPPMLSDSKVKSVLKDTVVQISLGIYKPNTNPLLEFLFTGLDDTGKKAIIENRSVSYLPEKYIEIKDDDKFHTIKLELGRSNRLIFDTKEKRDEFAVLLNLNYGDQPVVLDTGTKLSLRYYTRLNIIDTAPIVPEGRLSAGDIQYLEYLFKYYFGQNYDFDVIPGSLDIRITKRPPQPPGEFIFSLEDCTVNGVYKRLTRGDDMSFFEFEDGSVAHSIYRIVGETDKNKNRNMIAALLLKALGDCGLRGVIVDRDGGNSRFKITNTGLQTGDIMSKEILKLLQLSYDPQRHKNIFTTSRCMIKGEQKYALEFSKKETDPKASLIIHLNNYITSIEHSQSIVDSFNKMIFDLSPPPAAAGPTTGAAAGAGDGGAAPPVAVTLRNITQDDRRTLRSATYVGEVSRKNPSILQRVSDIFRGLVNQLFGLSAVAGTAAGAGTAPAPAPPDPVPPAALPSNPRAVYACINNIETTFRYLLYSNEGWTTYFRTYAEFEYFLNTPNAADAADDANAALKTTLKEALRLYLLRQIEAMKIKHDIITKLQLKGDDILGRLKNLLKIITTELKRVDVNNIPYFKTNNRCYIDFKNLKYNFSELFSIFNRTTSNNKHLDITKFFTQIRDETDSIVEQNDRAMNEKRWGEMLNTVLSDTQVRSQRRLGAFSSLIESKNEEIMKLLETLDISLKQIDSIVVSEAGQGCGQKGGSRIQKGGDLRPRHYDELFSELRNDIVQNVRIVDLDRRRYARSMVVTGLHTTEGRRNARVGQISRLGVEQRTIPNFFDLGDITDIVIGAKNTENNPQVQRKDIQQRLLRLYNRTYYPELTYMWVYINSPSPLPLSNNIIYSHSYQKANGELMKIRNLDERFKRYPKLLDDFNKTFRGIERARRPRPKVNLEKRLRGKLEERNHNPLLYKRRQNLREQKLKKLRDQRRTRRFAQHRRYPPGAGGVGAGGVGSGATGLGGRKKRTRRKRKQKKKRQNSTKKSQEKGKTKPKRSRKKPRKRRPKSQ
jgi:plasmid stabilization system protein ParE